MLIEKLILIGFQKYDANKHPRKKMYLTWYQAWESLYLILDVKVRVFL